MPCSAAGAVWPSLTQPGQAILTAAQWNLALTGFQACSRDRPLAAPGSTTLAAPDVTEHAPCNPPNNDHVSNGITARLKLALLQLCNTCGRLQGCMLEILHCSHTGAAR